MRIERDLTKLTLIARNPKHDFYIGKVGNREWYAYCMDANTNINTGMAGFSTKKAATEACKIWGTWM